MLIGIGTKKAGGDVVDLLQDCHTRIRSFSRLALRISEAEDAPGSEVAEAAARVRRYFTVALPHHVADEEESVLPRLAGKDARLDAALERMEEEHEGHVEPLRRLVALTSELASKPERLPALREALRREAELLVEAFDAHLRAEEEVVFPAIREKLSDEEREAILTELRRRRQARD